MVVKAVSQFSLIQPGDRVLCALSGGADSVCLTHLLATRATELGITVAAVAECGDSPRAVSAEMRRLLASAPRLRGLFVTAPIVGAAVAALGEAKRKITVVGSDFTRPALDALRAGSVAALLYSSPERQMEHALIELCNRLAGRRSDGAAFRIRQELVLKSNLENYLL